MKDSSLGSFLQQLRKENQLTQKELASQLHVTDKAVSKWELGDAVPDTDKLVPLVRSAPKFVGAYCGCPLPKPSMTR